MLLVSYEASVLFAWVLVIWEVIVCGPVVMGVVGFEGVSCC